MPNIIPPTPTSYLTPISGRPNINNPNNKPLTVFTHIHAQKHLVDTESRIQTLLDTNQRLTSDLDCLRRKYDHKERFLNALLYTLNGRGFDCVSDPEGNQIDLNRCKGEVYLDLRGRDLRQKSVRRVTGNDCMLKAIIGSQERMIQRLIEQLESCHRNELIGDKLSMSRGDCDGGEKSRTAILEGEILQLMTLLEGTCQRYPDLLYALREQHQLDVSEKKMQLSPRSRPEPGLGVVNKILDTCEKLASVQNPHPRRLASLSIPTSHHNIRQTPSKDKIQDNKDAKEYKIVILEFENFVGDSGIKLLSRRSKSSRSKRSGSSKERKQRSAECAQDNSGPDSGEAVHCMKTRSRTHRESLLQRIENFPVSLDRPNTSPSRSELDHLISTSNPSHPSNNTNININANTNPRIQIQPKRSRSRPGSSSVPPSITPIIIMSPQSPPDNSHHINMNNILSPLNIKMRPGPRVSPRMERLRPTSPPLQSDKSPTSDRGSGSGISTRSLLSRRPRSSRHKMGPSDPNSPSKNSTTEDTHTPVGDGTGTSGTSGSLSLDNHNQTPFQMFIVTPRLHNRPRSRHQHLNNFNNNSGTKIQPTRCMEISQSFNNIPTPKNSAKDISINANANTNTAPVDKEKSKRSNGNNNNNQSFQNLNQNGGNSGFQSPRQVRPPRPRSGSLADYCRTGMSCPYCSVTFDKNMCPDDVRKHLENHVFQL